jgi:predicted transcriptional regulator
MRTLHIRLESEKESWERLQRVARQIDAGQKIRAQEGLSFTDMATYLASITSRRLEAAFMLKELGPSSIRALAKAVGRDYKSVHQDVQKLSELGLIEKRDDGLIKAPYDRIVTDLRFTNPTKQRSHQPALLDSSRNEARKKRVRLERA